MKHYHLVHFVNLKFQKHNLIVLHVIQAFLFVFFALIYYFKIKYRRFICKFVNGVLIYLHVFNDYYYSLVINICLDIFLL
jgi:hypothetical protein